MAVDSMVSGRLASFSGATGPPLTAVLELPAWNSYVQTCEGGAAAGSSRRAPCAAQQGWSSTAVGRIKEGLVIGEDPELDAQRFLPQRGAAFTLVSAEMLGRPRLTDQGLGDRGPTRLRA